MKLSWIGPLVVVIALVLSTVGCGDGQPGTTPSPTASGPATAPPVTSPPGVGPFTETAMVSLKVVVQPQGVAEIAFDPLPYGVDSFPRNSTVTITVSPQPGWRLKEWAGPAYKVVGHVAKVFTDNPHTVSVLLEPDGSPLPVAPTPGVLTQPRPTMQVPVPTSTPVIIPAPIPGPVPPVAPVPGVPPVPVSTVVPEPIPPTVPAPTLMPTPDGARIVFSSGRDGNYEIYVMNADGSNQTRLTNDQNYDYSPSWSPYGARIAFRSERDGNFEIYVMNADGSGQIRLTEDPGDDWHPSWSPDGTKIAFYSNRDGNYEFYVMNVDGSNQTRLTDDPAHDRFPAWGRGS